MDEIEVRSRGRAAWAGSRRLTMVAVTVVVVGLAGFLVFSSSGRSDLQGGDGAGITEPAFTSIYTADTFGAIDPTDTSDVVSTEATTTLRDAPLIPVPSGSDPTQSEPTTNAIDTTTTMYDPMATTTVAWTGPTSPPQDVYRDICVPLNWVRCAEYQIYDAGGNPVNRGVGNSDWTLAYIAELGTMYMGTGMPGAYAVKIRDIYPL